MRPETRTEILNAILNVFFNADKSGKTVFKSDFRGLRHNKGHVQQVRMDLLCAGIIEHSGRGFVLGKGIFERREQVLENVRALRNGDPVEMNIATKDLLRVFSAKEVSKAKTFKEFLQAYNLQALTQGEDVVEVTHVDELWVLFVEILNESQKFSWLLNDLTDVIWKTIMLANYSNTALKKEQEGGMTLDETLILGVRKAILDMVYSKTYPMYESVVIKLFFILRELDSESEALVKVIMDLLSRPTARTDFSKQEQTFQNDERLSEEQRLPDIWHAPEGHSRLFKVVYGMLENMENKPLRELLQQWGASKDINLKLGASIFLDYMFKKDKYLKKARIQIASSDEKNWKKGKRA